MNTAPNVFTPAKLGPVTLRNRIIKAATFEAPTPDALVTDDLITYHRLPAAGGVYLFRGDAPVKEFAAAFKPPLRWGIRMTGKKFFREYPYREAYLLRDAKLFRAELKMPLILLGGITNRETMDLAMAEGFDFVAMGRALLAEPDLINRIHADGDEHSVRSACTHCNQCMATIYSHTHCVVTGSPG
jgi:2,4-dienoyl-CoA reductase-like NADH-dependent reductase (Old Yellow Enzyme family)